MSDSGLTDTEIGLADALTTLTEVFLALGVPPETLAQPLEFQRNAHRAAGRANAAVVLDSIIDYVRDPERQRRRQILELFQKEPPKGSA
jgi:hypothetical protein